MSLLSAGTLITDEAVLRPGWIETNGVSIVGVGAGLPPRPADLDLPEMIAAPGFVDMHVHGGGGQTYTSQSPNDVLLAVTHHRARGTTSTLGSLISANLEALENSIHVLADLVDDGVLAGIHLEGPWLNSSRGGAHDIRLLRDPTPQDVQRLLDAGAGTVRMVTLAPELAGGLDAVRRVVDGGAVAAVGHTAADHDTTRAAIDAGATVATHLFNGMPTVHHREPGPVVALLNDPRVTIELIADGVHLHPAILTHVEHAVGADRIALVTDAMPAAGMPDGRYEFGGLAVDVAAGVVRRADTGSIAGSTVHMDDLFRVAARATSLLRAARMTASTPARALRLPMVGRLEVGCLADIVLLNHDLQVCSVMRRGEWL